MPSSAFATLSRFTFRDLVFLSIKICEKSMFISRWISKLFLDVPFIPCEVLIELYGLVLPLPMCWLRRNVFSKWFISDLVLNIRKACAVGSAVQRICLTVPASDSCCKTSCRNFVIVASAMSAENPVATARVDLSASSQVSFVVHSQLELLKSLLFDFQPQPILPVDARQRGDAVVHLCELRALRVDPALERVADGCQ